jgi:hypothetical protein
MILLFLFIAIVLIRSRWIVWQAAQYTTSALYWAMMTKQPISVTKEMSEVWPIHQMFLYLWIWDFRHFVVYRGHYDAMQAFLLSELKREDRGPEIFDQQEPDTKDDTHGPN